MPSYQQSVFQPFLMRLVSRSRLGLAEQQAILDLPGDAVQVRTNRDFVRLGQRVDHASLIVDGLVGRFGQNREGNRQITAIHIPGDMADLHSVVFPNASSALQALSTTTIIRVPHAALRARAAQYPALAEAFWRDGIADAAILSEWVVNVGRRDARSRTAHLFCELATRWKETDADGHFSFRLEATQTHLADALGLTSVHVNRMLQLLKRENVIAIANRLVTILDWARLVDIGDFDPDYLQIDGPLSLRDAISA
jgi:CRP-like cAMP-binding protein